MSSSTVGPSPLARWLTSGASRAAPLRVVAFLVTAVLLFAGLVVPSPAAATPPTETPEWTYRLDTREPDEIFADGFKVGASPSGVWNTNLLDHAAFTSTYKTVPPTWFVSTTADPTLAHFGGGVGIEPFIYKVRTSPNMFSMERAVEHAMVNSPHDAIRNRARQLWDQWVEAESEWVASAGINTEQIVWGLSLEEFYDDPDLFKERFPTEESWLDYLEDPENELKEWNDEFSWDGGIANSAVLPIEEWSFGRGVSCVSVASVSARGVGGCSWERGVPGSEEELAGVHAENLAEGFGDVRFELSPAMLEGRAGAVLSPLVESGEVFAGFDAGGGAASLKVLGGELKAALASDLARLEEVSAHASTVSKALVGAGKTVSKASELLPYLAIAATGYALSEDVRSGDWANAGFDGVAEGLMLVGAAQPELLVFTEPMLLLDLAVQWLVDDYRARNAPPPVMEPWQREEADRDLKVWDELPATLAGLRLEEMEQQLVAATEVVMRENIVPALQARLASDVRTLDQLAATYRLAAHRAAVRAAGGAFEGPAFEAVRPHRDEMMATIDAAFAEQEQTRREAYSAVLGEQVQAVADHFGLEWGAGSAAYKHIEAEFDREVAVPTVTTVEGLLAEYSRFQNPPIKYPMGDGLAQFRADLKASKLTGYGNAFRALLPRPFQVDLPHDTAEYARLLAGGDPEGKVVHRLVWGRAVPGGITEEIRIHDPRASLTGTMTIAAPSGVTVESIRTSSDGPVLNIAADKKSATVGTLDAPVTFGGTEGVTVFVTMRTSGSAKPGSTVRGGSVVIANHKSMLFQAPLDVVVHDTIPAGHGFAAPGGVTEDVVIEDPHVTTTGEMVLTAPPGTTFEQVTSSAGGTVSLSGDRKTATVHRAAFGGGAAAVRAKVRIPSNAGHDQVFSGGRAVVTDNGVTLASGPFTVSTQPATVSQTVTPSLIVDGRGKATVRITNHVPRDTSGIGVVFTAPTGTLFAHSVLEWKNKNGAGGTNMGVLSEDHRTITYTAKDFALMKGGWTELTVTLHTSLVGGGTINDGRFTISPGSGIAPAGTSTALSYHSVIADIPSGKVSAGPGQTTPNITIKPSQNVAGTLTITAPEHTTFAPGSVAIMGAVVPYSLQDGGRKLVISRAGFGGSGAYVVFRLNISGDARPTRTYTGTTTVTDNNVTVASGTYTTAITSDGCLTLGSNWIPLYGLVAYGYVATVHNKCAADITVKVIYSNGWATGAKTVGHNNRIEIMPPNLTPYIAPNHIEIQHITPNP